MAMSLTALQLDCARVIFELTETEGRCPTFADIAREMDVNLSTVHRLVLALAERGWLQPRRKGSKRSLVLLLEPFEIEECDVDLTPQGQQVVADAWVRP